MSKSCIVVADGSRARFFSLDPASPRAHELGPLLIEQESLISEMQHRHHPGDVVEEADHSRAASGGAGRNDDTTRTDHDREIQRKFAAEVIGHAAKWVTEWDAKSVIFVADARMLGELRKHMGRLRNVAIREEICEVSWMPATELYAWLSESGVISRRLPVHVSH